MVVHWAGGLALRVGREGLGGQIPASRARGLPERQAPGTALQHSHSMPQLIITLFSIQNRASSEGVRVLQRSSFLSQKLIDPGV